jgi:hypothetical protein
MERSSRLVFGLATLVLATLSAHAATDERNWKSVVPIESHVAGDTSTPQFAFDQNGNVMAVWRLALGESSHLFASRYTVIDRVWSSPFQLDNSDGSSAAPQVAVDANGNALAVWSQSTGVQARRFNVGTKTWGAITPLQQTAGNATAVQVAFDNTGHAMAVWHQSDGTNNSVRARRYTVSNNQWLPVETLSNAGNAMFPQVAMEAGGDAVVVWRQTSASSTDIVSNRYTAVNQTWSGPGPVENNAGSATTPQVAVEGTGTARAIWVEFDLDATNPNGGRNRVWSSRFVGGTWQAAEPVESNSGDSMSPQVTVDASGNALAVWQQFDGAHNTVWTSRRLPGATQWEGALLLQADGTLDAAAPAIARDANGNALALWQQVQASTLCAGLPCTGIWAARYTPSATIQASWSPAALIERDNRGNAAQARIAFNANGTALALWSQSDGTSFHVIANRYALKEWGAAVKLSASTTADVVSGDLATDANGNVLALWGQFDGQFMRVRASRYTAGVGWDQSRGIGRAAAETEENPRAAFDADGNAEALWIARTNPSSSNQSLWSNRYLRSGDRWNGVDPVAVNFTGNGRAAPIVFDSQDNLFLSVWTNGSHVSSSRWLGGFWQTVQNIEPNLDFPSDGVQLVSDASGHALAAWARTDNSTWLNGFSFGQWGTAARIHATSLMATAPRLAVDAGGNGVMAFDQAQNSTIWALRLTGGASAGLIQQVGSGFLFNKQAFSDGNGNATVVGTPLVPGSSIDRLSASHYTASTDRWSAPELLPAAKSLPRVDSSGISGMQAAGDRTGNSIVVWNQLDIGDDIGIAVWAARYAAGTWGAPVRLDRVNGNAPLIRFDPQGNAVALWLDADDSGFLNVWTSRFE